MAISNSINKGKIQAGECPVPKLKQAVQQIKRKRNRKISYYRILKHILANIALKG